MIQRPNRVYCIEPVDNKGNNILRNSCTGKSIYVRRKTACNQLDYDYNVVEYKLVPTGNVYGPDGELVNNNNNK